MNAMSDLQARLVATLALTQDKSLLEMAADMRALGESLKREPAQPSCQFCDTGRPCWWHKKGATP